MLLREQTCDSNTVLKMNRIMEITIDSFLGHTFAMTKEEIMAQRGQVLCEMSQIKLTMTSRIIRTERSSVFKAMGEKIQAAFGLWDGQIIFPHFLDTITKAWKVAADLESRIHIWNAVHSSFHWG